MWNKRIAITGVGIVSPIGIGKTAYWKALREGQSGIKPITLFNSDPYKVKLAGEASLFDPGKNFSKKELIYFDRATMLLLTASKSALGDAQITINDENTHDIGVAIGTTFGSLQSLSEFDKESVNEGPQFVNPSHFPNAVANLPASQVSIYFKIKGFNVTVSTGMCASLDAIDFAIKAIQYHGRKIVVTGTVEEMCEHTFLGFYKLRALSGCENGEIPISCPFDQRRNGIIFSEGSGAIILEDFEYAKNRGARVYAEILSIASNFDPFRLNRYNPRGTGMVEVMELALSKAHLTPRDIDYICANANSTYDADLIETQAIRQVFGDRAYEIPVSSIKSMIGETYSAAGCLSAIASIGAMQNDFVPPTINYIFKDPQLDLDFVVNTSRELSVNTIMINSFGQNGANSSLIIKKTDRTL